MRNKIKTNEHITQTLEREASTRASIRARSARWDRIYPELRKKLLTTEEVARILDVHVDAVNTLVDMELLTHVTNSPRFDRRFREEDVRFLALK